MNNSFIVLCLWFAILMNIFGHALQGNEIKILKERVHQLEQLK